MTTMIGGLTMRGGLEAVMTIEGGTDGDVFVAFLDHVLGPILHHGDLVVLDNAGAHKDQRVKTVLAKYGAKPVYLPPYSPELSPIELVWSILKAFLKTAKARCVATLNNCIQWGMQLITADTARECYRHCGYTAQLT